MCISYNSSVTDGHIIFATDILSPNSSQNQQQKLLKSVSANDEAEASSSPAARIVEPLTCILCTFISFICFRFLLSGNGKTNLLQTFLAAEGFIRGRSYNIRMDNNILLRFSPKNSESNYYFSDMVCLLPLFIIMTFSLLFSSLALTNYCITDWWNTYFLSRRS